MNVRKINELLRRLLPEDADLVEELYHTRHMEAAKCLSEISIYKGHIEELEGALREIAGHNFPEPELEWAQEMVDVANKALNND